MADLSNTADGPWLGPNVSDFMMREYQAKSEAATEAREKLTKFERLADHKNEEMMEMINQMRETTKSLERSAEASKPQPQSMELPSMGSNQEVVALNARDSKGFYIPWRQSEGEVGYRRSSQILWWGQRLYAKRLVQYNPSYQRIAANAKLQ